MLIRYNLASVRTCGALYHVIDPDVGSSLECTSPPPSMFLPTCHVCKSYYGHLKWAVISWPRKVHFWQCRLRLWSNIAPHSLQTMWHTQPS